MKEMPFRKREMGKWMVWVKDVKWINNTVQVLLLLLFTIEAINNIRIVPTKR